MSSSPDPVAFSDTQASLSLFAEAIAGRPPVFTVVDDAAECWPQRASNPESHDVVVPSQLAARDEFRAIVLHQLLVQPSPRDRHVASDPHFRTLYAIVEDHRVHAETARRYPGAERSKVQALAIGAESLRSSDSLLDNLRRYSVGAPVRPGADQDVLQASYRLLDRVTAPSATAQTSAQIAERLAQLLTDLGSGVALADLVADLETDAEDLGLPSDAPTSVSLDDGTPSAFVDSDGLGGGNVLDGFDDVPTMADLAEDGDDVDQVHRLGLELPWSGQSSDLTDRRTYVYDEWDYHDQQHRPAWCRVVEEKLSGDNHDFIVEVRTRHRALRSRIRRSLTRLRSDDLMRVYRSDDGDELDLDAAIEAIADRRSGAPADDRLHVRRDRAARDVATAFLVDLSASTSSPAVPPEPEPIPETDPMDDPMSYGPLWHDPPAKEPVRRVIDVAKDAVALMGDALHELGDRYAVYGFSGTGRESVEFKIGKDFSDRVSAVSWAGIAAMKPLRYTRMGPAVRHATAKLAAEPARTKLLIVVSDGYPQDTDYGRDRHDRDYGIHDTARALSDANAAGIETFCVTIDPAGHDYLRTMCPDHRYLVIEDVESLPEELAKLYLGRFHAVPRVEVTQNAQH